MGLGLRRGGGKGREEARGGDVAACLGVPLPGPFPSCLPGAFSIMPPCGLSHHPTLGTGGHGGPPFGCGAPGGVSLGRCGQGPARAPFRYRHGGGLADAGGVHPGRLGRGARESCPGSRGILNLPWRAPTVMHTQKEQAGGNPLARMITGSKWSENKVGAEGTRQRPRSGHQGKVGRGEGCVLFDHRVLSP